MGPEVLTTDRSDVLSGSNQDLYLNNNQVKIDISVYLFYCPSIGPVYETLFNPDPHYVFFIVAKAYIY